MENARLSGMNKWVLCLAFGLLIFGIVSGDAENKILKEFDGKDKIRVVLKVPERSNFKESTSAIKINNFGFNENKIKRRVGNLFSVEMSLNEFGKLSGVEVVGIDREVHAFLQDARGIVGAEDIWNLNFSGQKINGSRTAVCVIDTGVDATHPDLTEKILAQYCFCSAKEGGNSDCCPDGTNEDDNATDNHGHGTHVAGIIAASGGIEGIADGANIVAVKVLNSSGSGYDSDIRAAIEWCSADAQVSAYNISVISLSLGGGQYADVESCDDPVNTQSVINAAIAKNISVVVATGNGDPSVAIDGIASPACLNNVIRVTASTKADAYASYAFRHANFPDILVAPGGSENNQVNGINSTQMGGGYVGYRGTSMSAPVVSGLIAMINQYLDLNGRSESPFNIWNALNSSGTVLDDSAGSGYNFSRVNGYEAILIFDEDAPVVGLVSPGDNHINITINQSFICNASDWQLKNITLEVWNSSELYYNGTKNLTGFQNQTSFNLTRMPLGQYFWNCFAYDNRSNLGFAISNFSLTIGAIEVDVNYPANGSYTNLDETNFSCTSRVDSGYELNNVSFYLWNSSGNLVENEIRNITGIENTTIFNYTFSVDDDYSWNCIAFTNSSEKSGGSNYSLTYDSMAPSLVLTSLPSGATSSSISRDFEFNVSDENIANCSLIVNGAISLTNSSINISETQLFSQTFSPGSYTWNINCSDLAGNVNVSDENNFVITAPSISVSSSGGGGFNLKFYDISSTQLSSGYSVELKAKDKVSFSLASGKHTLSISKVGSDFADILIESDPIYLTLKVGEDIKLNLSSPDYNDTYVKLNSVKYNSANISIKKIFEEVVIQNNGTVTNKTDKTELVDGNEKRKGSFFWVWIFVILIALCIIYFYIHPEKLKRLIAMVYDGKNKKIKT